MTELDKAVQRFREVRGRNVKLIARVQQLEQTLATRRLFDAAARRLWVRQRADKAQAVTR